MKEFFEELMYMCSSNNSTSRGLYIFIAIAMVLMLLGGVGSLVLLLVNLIVYKTFKIMWLVLTIAIFVILTIVIVWLKKS